MALRGANLAVASGEVHALLGGNGAGKSTMVGIITGHHRPDGGNMLLEGKSVVFASPRQSLATGISVIHQELSLLPDLSVAENIVLGRPPRRTAAPWLVDWRATKDVARRVLNDLGLELAPDVPVGALPTGLRQQVEIARAVSAKPKILIMDEPTSALSKHEVEHLLALVRRLHAQGLTIVYISHHLDEIRAIADRLTVLRDGMDVLAKPVAEASTGELALAMVGKAVELTRRPRPAEPGAVRLRLEAVTTRALRGVSLELRAGEVVGLAGALGSGRTEIMRAIIGLDPLESGRMALEEGAFSPRGPADALDRGVALLPEDRKQDGLVLDMTIADNLTLPFLERLTRIGFVRAPLQAKAVEIAGAELGIRMRGPSQRVGDLSGGNQQKVILGRWLAMAPRVLLLDQPMRGLDIRAKDDVYELIARLSASGAAILVAATELAELLHCCHRIVIIKEGRIVGTFADTRGLDKATLTQAVLRDEVDAVNSRADA